MRDSSNDKDVLKFYELTKHIAPGEYLSVDKDGFEVDGEFTRQDLEALTRAHIEVWPLLI